MSKALAKIKHKKLSIHKHDGLISKYIKEHNIDVQIGDMVIADDGDTFRVQAFKRDGVELWEYDYEHCEAKERTWHRYSTIEYREFNGRYIKLDKPVEEIEKEVLDKCKNVESLDPDNENKDKSDSHELQPGLNKEVLISMRNVMDERRKNFEIMERILEGKRRWLNSYVHEMSKRIEKIQKVIDVIELYLGINEEIVEIKDGEQAPQDTPIIFRQQILYMDEEVGDPADKGLDFRKIDQFDEWVTKPENLKRMLPEIRGVVIIKPRRYERDYGHWYINSVYNAENKRTYILIRNGERVYRINSENLQVSTRLFPVRDEFEEKIIKERHGYYDEERVKGNKFDYKKNALMMQGLIDRTNVFYPHKPDLSIFDPKTWADGSIQFIHDDEVALPPQKQYWKDWHKEINSHIQRGSRIYFAGAMERKEMSYYVDYQFKNTASCPHSGVYKVVNAFEAGDEQKYRFNPGNKLISFIYNPKDTVRPGWGDSWRDEHERKKGITFTCCPDEDFVLNYDRISLEDVEYYINSRIDRENYLSMIPVLWAIKKERIKEIEWEKHFVKLVADRTGVAQEQVWKAVNWWKYKNIWKRPIREEDAKALRMIERKAVNPKLWSKKDV
jgi:hypothetical protein